MERIEFLHWNKRRKESFKVLLFKTVTETAIGAQCLTNKKIYWKNFENTVVLIICIDILFNKKVTQVSDVAMGLLLFTYFLLILIIIESGFAIIVI